MICCCASDGGTGGSFLKTVNDETNTLRQCIERFWSLLGCCVNLTEQNEHEEDDSDEGG